jgi:signal transduction histidine kinase
MATDLETRLAEFPTLGAGIAHEIANPLVVILTNATMIAGELAALRDRFAPGHPLRAELDQLAEAQGDVVTAAEKIEALAVALRELRTPPPR